VWDRIPAHIHDQIIELALDQSKLVPRELAVRFTYEKRYFVSEASVCRLLKPHDLITSPAFMAITLQLTRMALADMSPPTYHLTNPVIMMPAMQLYISEYVGSPDRAQSIIKDIVISSSKRNERLSVTGGLIFTGKHFGQILEGDGHHLDSLMASIERDERHRMLKVFDQADILVPRFASWSLMYAGPSHYVSKHLTRLITSTQDSNSERAKERLIELMQEFAPLEEPT
jgi:hypothetical protein